MHPYNKKKKETESFTLKLITGELREIGPCIMYVLSQCADSVLFFLKRSVRNHLDLILDHNV